ncbi:hypothetical protein SGM_1721 [Streptomyces griseoaurantiacus M045]|uniref:Uncharacterized protein n=1 Tax=Streptomyces griseoaurantiacus M045 TaxID=996637 RepID=F3NF07_9ACTN|nr:hypothetical protein SGM_1721 [Streptomyces griseoaurantiacus M045]
MSSSPTRARVLGRSGALPRRGTCRPPHMFDGKTRAPGRLVAPRGVRDRRVCSATVPAPVAEHSRTDHGRTTSGHRRIGAGHRAGTFAGRADQSRSLALAGRARCQRQVRGCLQLLADVLVSGGGSPGEARGGGPRAAPSSPPAGACAEGTADGDADPADRR